ncbi:MAG: phosphatase PAP2 family protein [Planctomycetota bacterium]|nr:phosphatase PAP2 family protein [Planctomycetota bacterium]
MQPRTQRFVRGRRFAALVLFTSVGITGCATARGPDATGHFEGRTWSGAWEHFRTDESQWVAPALLAVATPIVWAFDQDTAEDSVGGPVFDTNTQTGDNLAIGLGAAPLVLGTFDAFGGDSRFLEVSAESLAVTMAMSYAMKLLINRERPDGTSEDSFPSAHTAFAFAGATLLARDLEERCDTWLGYLAYLPATYVGISRLEGQRHYLADITFGAALALFTTNLLYDAHYGSKGAPGIFGSESRVRMSLVPAPDGPGLGVGLTWSF